MKKNKGIKIYKQRKKNKGNSNQLFSILGTCAVVFGLGVFGYYVVAHPFVEFLGSSKNNKNGNSSQTVEVTTDTPGTKVVTQTTKITTTKPVTNVTTSTTTPVTTVTSSATQTQTTVK